MPTIAVNGIELNYLDEGSGEPLLLIHNLTSSIEGFAGNVPALAEHYRTIAADNRGHGHTTHEESPERAEAFYTFDNIVEDYLQLLDALEVDRFHVFGQAYWGVGIALSLFLRAPDRVRAIVLAESYLMSTDEGQQPYDLLGETGRQNFIRMHELAREEGMLAVYEDRLRYGQFWSEKVRGDPEILAVFEEAHRLTSPMAFVTIPHVSHERRAAVVKELTARRPPLMMLLGELEQAHDVNIEQMRGDYPGTHVMIIPGSGHYPTIENPYDFNRALLNFYAGADRCRELAEKGLDNGR